MIYVRRFFYFMNIFAKLSSPKTAGVALHPRFIGSQVCSGSLMGSLH